MPIIKALTTSIIVLAYVAPSAIGQVPIVPAKTVAQTQFPVFENTFLSRKLSNFRLHLEYQSDKQSELSLTKGFKLPLPSGAHTIELVYQQNGTSPMQISTWIDGKALHANKVIPSSKQTSSSVDKTLRMDQNFTIAASFKTNGDGTIFSKCSHEGIGSQGSKALFVKNKRLTYNVGGVGTLRGPLVTDGKTHWVVLRSHDGLINIFIDGQPIGKEQKLHSRDVAKHVFRIGRGDTNLINSLNKVTVSTLRYWARSLEGAEFTSLVENEVTTLNTPDLNWSATEHIETFNGQGQIGSPVQLTLITGQNFKLKTSWVQPLETTKHAKLIRAWNKKALDEGKAIYNSHCITCHGDQHQEGSMPTALKFHESPFKNGSDPYRMFQTLDKGYGMMVPQRQFDAAQKYAVIHYIRETFINPFNKSQYFEPSEAYYNSLPQSLNLPGIATTPRRKRQDKPYKLMDFGPVLNWTFQINPGAASKDRNIAQKGINIRLNQGKGGISKGSDWMIYDTDTMRVATAYSGEFIDWRGIAFDGSHGTHSSIAGTALFTNPDMPAWQHPIKHTWKDTRIVGRDGRRYGPLPKDWVRYLGRYRFGQQTIIHYQIGNTKILELPGLLSDKNQKVFTRTLNIAASNHDLLSRISPPENGFSVALKGSPGISLERRKDGVYLHIPAATTPAKVIIGFANKEAYDLSKLLSQPADLSALTHGGPPNYPKPVITAGTLGNDEAPFAYDIITIPNKSDNPWHSWMRLGGFDFFDNDPNRAAVCTWLGDVWLVDGMNGNFKELRWRRICTGLFQPLGLKIVDNTIYVTCRDQIARLHDLNGDDEIDYVEAFNNDHQVTEHFHEFAMGLQTDAKGNFYYAKSARHGKNAVVPHHGTLLRVSADGSTTDIVATGFRAANGVCVNPDGTWVVTDQEGHWNPKNRINYVNEGGFYGNMFGYHDVTDSSDESMEQPLAWVTNAFDRSPAELLWVPEDAAWGAINGTLLNLSYGYGKVYTVPHEVLNGQAQGGMCALPIEASPSGLHRGRFHPVNKQLYAAGMFAWAGNQQSDGSFCRIRATGKPSYMPIKTNASKGKYTITFSDPLPEETSFQVKVWNLKRTAKYGSKHYDERELEVTKTMISGNQATLIIPNLEPTWGMEIACHLGNNNQRIIHASIHELP
ncbi:c-type cytochrome [Verrucomicrobiaceae bacterium 5K15]|uniref:C-type cytochrome n=1 Tax=Oceaniferula flava TaxID=2800421 RepID=A0AAE2SEH0_9BACT|nr:DUF6797 domain-containing protein [Oceaniferula flavus]MBK1855055.1 c-type cytochrome [Oceaniferula flavus]MBM1136361.1 c-type cytochrome [Oceaniferula flavus]